MNEKERGSAMPDHRDSNRPWIVAAVGFLLLILVVGNVILTFNVFTSQFPGMNDFMSRWEGARSYLVDGVSPYSDEATLNIQNRIYGRPVIENEDPGLFVYPFYTIWLVAPTVSFSYAWASAIWMVFLEVCLIGGMFLLLSLYKWQPAPWLLAILMLYALLDYWAGRGLFLGQPSHVVYVLQIFTVWAIFRQRDAAAGFALAVSTIKPQMGYLLVPLLLIWSGVNGRWRIIGAFLASFALLLISSFALQPDWFGDWFDQVRQYPEYTAAAYPDTGAPVWIVIQHYLGLGSAAEVAVTLLFVLLLGWAWWRLLVGRRNECLLWTIALTLVITHLIALRTATPHFVVFNLVLIFLYRRIEQRWGGWAVLLSVMALMVLNWSHFLISVQGRASLEHPSLFLPFPFFVLVVLILTRRMWWEDDSLQVKDDVARDAGLAA